MYEAGTLFSFCSEYIPEGSARIYKSPLSRLQAVFETIITDQIYRSSLRFTAQPNDELLKEWSTFLAYLLPKEFSVVEYLHVFKALGLERYCVISIRSLKHVLGQLQLSPWLNREYDRAHFHAMQALIETLPYFRLIHTRDTQAQHLYMPAQTIWYVQ